MAKFDFRTQDSESELLIKVATFDHGTVNLLLKKQPLSDQEISDLTASGTANEKTPEEISAVIQSEKKSREIQIAILGSIAKNGIDEVVDGIGAKPSMWLTEYAAKHKIEL